MRDYEFYYTQDGSIGLYSYADDDVYHSKFGALTESWEKFVLPSGIEEKLNTVPNIRVLDVCYGIGYNTKALMSYVINANNNFIKQKNKNKLEKFLEKILRKNKKNKSLKNYNIASIDSNNIILKKDLLLQSIETQQEEIISNIEIDCLEINNELVKISPLLKTVITPQEIFSRIVPEIFTCFETYWKIKRFLTKISYKFTPKNKRAISEHLDLKFNNDYDEIENSYRVHKFVNYILIDKLIDKYKDKYIDNNLKGIIKDKKKKHFFDYPLINYAKFKQNYRYNLLSKMNLFAFLHNIYYEYLSKRYKNEQFNRAESLFKLNYHVDDARSSILKLQGQYDYIFLDAFTFSKAPELWTVEFMAELYSRLSPRGLLMTYSNSALVRNTFLENNFYIGKIYNKKTNKYIGTVAAKDKSMIEYPLSNYELGLCSTRAGIPYRDPGLNLSKEEILKRREYDFKTSDLMTSSQYFKSRTQSEGEPNDD